MVPAVVPELQLISLAAKREAQQLMSQANSENGLAPCQLAKILLPVGHRLGVAGSIREKDSVRVKRKYILSRSLGRNHRHPAALFRKHSQNVFLTPAIVRHPMQ